MSRRGEWIANCMPERVDRIRSASIYLLKVGRPKPNQLQSLPDLEDKGLVGLYRVGRKLDEEVRQGQASYLAESDFVPTPDLLYSFVGPAHAQSEEAES